MGIVEDIPTFASQQKQDTAVTKKYHHLYIFCNHGILA